MNRKESLNEVFVSLEILIHSLITEEWNRNETESSITKWRFWSSKKCWNFCSCNIFFMGKFANYPLDKNRRPRSYLRRRKHIKLQYTYKTLVFVCKWFKHSSKQILIKGLFLLRSLIILDYQVIKIICWSQSDPIREEWNFSRERKSSQPRLSQSIIN